MQNSNKKDKITSIHKGHRSRVKDKFLNHGLESFSEFEVLEYLLFYAIPYKDTNEISHRLIEKFGSLKGVLDAESFDLTEVEGIGEYSAALIVLFRELNKYMNTRYYTNILLEDTHVTGEFCYNYFKNHVEESFIVLSLDDEYRLKCIDVISNGTENETAFYLRKVTKVAVKNRTNIIVLAHNHPSGSPIPSSDDITITEIIQKSLHNIGVLVKDHVICSPKGFGSFSDKGLLKH